MTTSPDDAHNDIAAIIEAAPEIDADDSDETGQDGEHDGRDEPMTADPAVVNSCALLDQNDTDNGARLIAHFGQDLLFVREIGWHHWEGTHWRVEGGLHAVRLLAQETARRIKLEAHALAPSPADRRVIEAAEGLAGRSDPTDEDKATLRAAASAAERLGRRRKARRDFAVSSGNRARCENLIAQAEPVRAVATGDIDADALAFNVANGTLIFSRAIVESEDPDSGEVPVMRREVRAQVELVAHERARRITKATPFAYNPRARCDRWADFMQTYQPDERDRRFLQVAAGAGMIGGAKTQALIFLYGEGQNGKSVFMEVIGRVLGDYAGRLLPASIAGLDTARGDQASPDFARLQGTRFVAISELQRGSPLKEGLVKAMTGGEPMPVRHLNRGFFDLLPEFIPFMSGNQLPEIGGLDKGIWRRMKFVHWPVNVSETLRRPMPEVVAGYMVEGEGILAWLVEGALIFLREGLVDPPGVTRLTGEHRSDLDPVGAFVAACVLHKDGGRVQARDLYKAFQRWCAVNAVREWKEKAFSLAMKAKGYVRLDERVRKWAEIELDMIDIPQLPNEGDRYG